jgi:prepilin-type N-terminal cleavage/methylation domain-containing protein
MQNMFVNRKIHAFTLAEVLIVIGIIGIVAALTIPTLIKNYQKQLTAMKLKKSYSELKQIIKLSENDNGDISGWDFTSKVGDEFSDKYIAPYIKSTKTVVPTLQKYKYKQSSGKTESGLRISWNPVSCYQLLSGATICVLQTNTSKDDEEIILDLNGYKATPNQFGKDIFFIKICSNLGIILHQRNDGEACTTTRTAEQLKNGPSAYSYQCNKTSRGMWCGALIQRSDWTIPKDYPW